MEIADVDKRWMDHMQAYIYYWLMAYGAILLLLSEFFSGYPSTFGGFIIHIYMSVFMVPLSRTAITTGYVTRGWAWTHHRLWYLRVTGQPAPKE